MANDKTTTGRRNPFFDASLMRRLSEPEAAWLAGVIEGEGCIRLQVADIRDWRTKRVSRDRVTMSVGLNMKDFAVVQRAAALVGGRCGERTDGMASLTVSSHRALWMLEQVQPYMVGDKKPQALLAIEFQRQRTGGRRNTEQHAWEIDAARRISAMKRVGIYQSRKGPRATRLEAAVERICEIQNFTNC